MPVVNCCKSAWDVYGLYAEIEFNLEEWNLCNMMLYVQLFAMKEYSKYYPAYMLSYTTTELCLLKMFIEVQKDFDNESLKGLAHTNVIDFNLTNTYRKGSHDKGLSG